MIKINVKNGDKYGRLVVISEVQKINNCRKILCRCYCGNKFIINLSNLKRGQKSCGCLTTKRHGMSLNKIYFTWKNLRQRCLNPNQTGYKNYGGRGVKFCKRWEKFENFFNDMKDGYSDNLSIDRIDNNKGYSKKNCRWTNRKIQSRNKRSNIEYKGECATDASKRLGGNKHLVLKRIYDGWSIRKAFTTPVSNK